MLGYLIVAVMLPGILFAKQKQGVTLISDELGVIDYQRTFYFTNKIPDDMTANDLMT